jgi:predicted AAA+ superfamily ATPase
VDNSYLKRTIDACLKERLESAGAVLIQGAKWCGKTRTAEEHSESIFYLQDPSDDKRNMRLAKQEPLKVLLGKTPRLIDEWQLVPSLWDAVRFEVDRRRGEVGQFILTGSTTIPEEDIMHSGAGRISRLLMRPMSLFESLDSDGSVSLRGLFEGDDDIFGQSEKSLKDVAFWIMRGGWPESVGKSEKVAVTRVTDYVNTITGTDISAVDKVKKDPAVAMEVLRSLSRNISTPASTTTIRKGVVKDGSIPAENTMYSYLNALQRLFVVEDVRPWNPALRSKTAASKTWKRQLVDPSIAASLMHSSSEGIIKDLNTMGFLFESLCIRDLRVYAQSLGGEVCYYCDRTGLEADAIIHLHDGRWAAIEMKLGSAWVDEAAKNLLNLRKKVDEEKMGSPSFLMVLVSSGYAYKRDDGVLVVPIGCLRD